VIDLIAEALHDPLQLDEVENEPGLFVQAAFDGDAHAVVVPVEPLTPMAREGDEMGRREDQIVLGNRHAVFAASVHEVLQMTG
jgi:hypothetical protein